MRAERLLSLALLLQARGRMTARQLADFLEVSVRTIYRDIDALSAAGIPVYADRGPGGGFCLLDNYRTELTGLTKAEMRALFMLSIPGAMTQLGVDRALKGALLKLTAALPLERLDDERWVRQRVLLDWSAWSQPPEPLPNLHTVRRAVWESRRLWLRYRLEHGPYQQRFERRVDPYGLVAKSGAWYLVCSADGRMRTYDISDLLETRLTPEQFTRPEDFDLPRFWRRWCADAARPPGYQVKVRVTAELLSVLPQLIGQGVRARTAPMHPPDDQGWITLDLRFHTFREARTRILGLGRAVEVLQPEPLRESVRDFARRIVDLYDGAPRADGGDRETGEC